MCGIVGAFDTAGRRSFDHDRLIAMRDAVAHRGPDDSGVFLEPGIALASRRLALVDVENGRQPVTDDSGRFTVVANGELFDHRAERERLAARGARFRSRCDTEVWVHAFAIDGDDYLPSARGQFALAVWDRALRRLVLARDRFGICPLFTARVDGWLLFASEIKALFASGLVRAKLDPRGIDHVFAFLAASPVRSPFEGIAPLPPGHRLEAREDAPIRVRRFASIAFPDRGAERRAAGATETRRLIDEIAAALDGAVARRLAADAPVAAYLSGGVDSSLLVALAARHRPDLTALSVELRGVGPDEASLARETTRALGVRHVAVSVDAAGIHARFPALVRAAESPILDHASACLLALSEEVRARGFKAVVTGEGADEAFAGYPWTVIPHRAGGAILGRVISLGLGAAIGARRRPVARGALARTGAGRLYDLTGRARDTLYAPSFWEQLGSAIPGDDHAWDESLLARWAPLHRSLFADYEIVLGGHLLADKGDRVAMAHSVEPRFPFLDERVVELAASLHPSLKLHGGRDKWILRELARRHLPRRTARRRKTMFRALPVIHGPTRPRWVDQLLSPESLHKTGLFDAAAVARALAERGGDDVGPRRALLQGGLTAIVSTQLLAHLYLGGGLCELARGREDEVRR